jgi:carbon monoxide dehydrogenase subunit G
MKLENSFEVPATPDQAWSLLLDVPRVVPCMPGAELTDVVDDSNWKAKMNVKLGPISLTFATDVERREVDETARRVVLFARGREVRGRGQARATVESSLAAANGGTRIDIVTDLSLSGPAAQYGRGLVADVSSQLVGRFADCLRAQLEAGVAPAAAAEGAAPGSPEAEASAARAEAAVARSAKPVSGLRLGLAALFRSIIRLLRRLLRR